MSLMNLNLARKWRSKQIDEIVGQNLVVRLIKNSLFKNQIFPVYLFSGPRGCGKTSMARLFAAALNCDHLELFQKNPQQIKLPCLNCISCQSMQGFQHPDFIEIDAASHTGVDDMRHIVETASFVPVIGKKKIYLIDEAHMLSKAAFNALLKIFEEPPASVVFMLATTDSHKIIETVKSRTFQLFFEPIVAQDIVKHLTLLCEQENIAYDQNGLYLVAYQTEGSMRDAINLIERIRLVYPSVNQESVYEILGYIDENQILEIFKVIIEKSPKDLIELCINLNLYKYNSVTIWRKIIEILRMGLYIKYGIKDTERFSYGCLNTFDSIKLLMTQCSEELLIKMLDIAYSYELLFAKSSNSYQVLEMLLIKLCQARSLKYEKPDVPIKPVVNSDKNLVSNSNKLAARPAELQNQNANIQSSDSWNKFILEVEHFKDPLLLSIFKQCQVEVGANPADESNCNISLKFGKELIFFKDLLEYTKSGWEPIIKKIFGPQVQLDLQFNNSTVVIEQNIKTAPQKIQHLNNTVSSVVKPKENEEKIGINSLQNLEKTNSLLKIFPGTITYVSDN